MALWKVPELSQATAKLCWEACARMMWQWRQKNLVGYIEAAGSYATLNKGLTQKEMDMFYTQLGLRSLQNAKGGNLKHALKWTPVIFTDLNKTSGHAMVLTGHSQGVYTVVNPCAVESVDFDKDLTTCEAGTLMQQAAQVEGSLGSYIWYW